jgi:zona occludens toxin (predicted ATPase)
VITLVVGVPGSGKSYYTVTRLIVPALKAGRRVWAAFDIDLNRSEVREAWARHTGLGDTELRSRLQVVPDLSFLSNVGPNDLVVLDECQRFLRAGGVANRDELLWFETHRHLGCDVVLVTQDHTKIFKQISVLAEMVYQCSKKSFRSLVGFRGTTLVKVKAGVREKDTIRSETVTYDPLDFMLYRSYRDPAVQESSSGALNLLKSWPVRVGIFSVVLIVLMMSYKPWDIGSKSSRPAGGVVPRSIDAVKKSRGVEGDELFREMVLSSMVSEKVAALTVRITGSVGDVDGSHYWFMLCSGRSVPLSLLQAMFPSGVWSKRVDGTWWFSASGVEYVMGC